MYKAEEKTVYERSFGNRYFVVAVSLLIIVVALNWLAERLNQELVNAERVQFIHRLKELNAAVTLMQASLVAQDRPQAMAEFVGANPMNWIQNDVTHYVGEQALEESQHLTGVWVFDPKLRDIAYQPRDVSVESLRAQLQGEFSTVASNEPEWQRQRYSQWLRFRVVGLLSKDKVQSNKHSEYEGLVLQLMP